MRKLLVILVLVVGLGLTACEGGDTGERGDSVPFIGGTQGVSVTFLDRFPPDRILDGGEESFDVIVELTNEGETEVGADDITVTLSGFSPSVFGVTSGELVLNAPELLEANELNPDGSIISSFPVEVEFNDFIHEGTVAGTQEYPFRANVCYEYSTDVVTSICVKDNFRDDSEDSDLCSVTSARTSYNSAAPVQITSLEQTPAGQDSTRFVFTVENLGNGRVFQTGSPCDSSLSRTEDKVYVDVSYLQEMPEISSVSCNGLRDGNEDYVGFVDISNDLEGSQRQGGEVFCTVEFNEQSPRVDRFDIELSYAYEETARTSVIVENN